MMKNKLYKIVMFVLIITALSTTAFADDQIFTVYTDGVEIDLVNQPYITNNSVTYLPLKETAIALGFEVAYINESHSVSFTKDDIEAVFPINKAFAYINGEKVTLRNPIIAKNGVSYGEIAIFSDFFKYDIEFDYSKGFVIEFNTHKDLLANGTGSTNAELIGQRNGVNTLKNDEFRAILEQFGGIQNDSGERDKNFNVKAYGIVYNKIDVMLPADMYIGVLDADNVEIKLTAYSEKINSIIESSLQYLIGDSEIAKQLYTDVQSTKTTYGTFDTEKLNGVKKEIGNYLVEYEEATRFFNVKIKKLN